MNCTDKISTGVVKIDQLIEGGLVPGEILLVFGERGGGKTSFVFQTMLRMASAGLGTILLYTEGRVPMDRLVEMAGQKWPDVCESIWIHEAKTFEEQDSLVDRLEENIPPGTKLLVIDSVTACYRGSLGSRSENIPLNKALNRQFALIKDACRRTGLTAILTSEVTARMFGEGVKPVAAAILTYWADKVLFFERIQGNVRRVTVTKPAGRGTLVQLTERGLE